MAYARNILIAVDQLCNTVGGGWPDARICIDVLFFWDRDRTTGRRHCELSWLSEQNRLQLAPEFRR